MIKNYKGFVNVGSSILGYRVVPRIDQGEPLVSELDIENTGREILPSDSRRQRSLRKITYRKFMKSANRK